MPVNMSHCRFHNTLLALRECHVALRDAPDDEAPLAHLSSEEQRAAMRLLALCAEIAADYS